VTKAEIYSKYLTILSDLIKKSYNDRGLKASGNFERSLEQFQKGKVIGIKAEKWSSGMMQGGRKAGTYSNIGALKEWIKTKEGLPQVFKDNVDRFAFIIARKHFLEGVKVPNSNNDGKVFSEPIEYFVKNHLPLMWGELGNFYITEMSKEFKSILDLK